MLSPKVYNRIIADHQAKQRQNLLNVLNEHQFHDVTFVIGPQKTEYEANRAFFAAVSPVFRAMLYGKMKEGEPDAHVEIDDIDPSAFESVLKFTYCNDPELKESNVVLVKSISQRYQINLLSELCDEIFAQCMNASNFCSLLKQAVDLKLDNYVRRIQGRLMSLGQDVDSIIKSESFMRKDKSSMQVFLQSDYLKIKEEDLWLAVLQWAKRYYGAGDTDNTSLQTHLLKQVCPFIRFGLMSDKFFVNSVVPTECLSDKEIVDILCYFVCNDKPCGAFSVKPRARMYASIPYTIESSFGEHSTDDTSVTCRLADKNLKRGFITSPCLNPWIKIKFNEQKRVRNIQLGPHMSCGTKYIDDCFLQYSNDGVTWKTLRKTRFEGADSTSIQSITIDVQAKALRIRSCRKDCLAVGFLQIYE